MKEQQKFLSKEYKDIFTLKTKNYKEEVLQEKQVNDFLEKKSDIIILDKNIFKWFLKKNSAISLSMFKFDFIFPPNNQFKLAFKNEQMRDLFNMNLKIIKEEGLYQEIIDNYIESNILEKVEINTFFSALLSKYIFLKDIKEINNILKKLSQFEYIDKIEVYADKLLAFSNNRTYTKYMKQESYYSVFNIPQKVGYIKIYYNEEKLKKAVENVNFIPNVKIFDNLKSYAHLKRVYSGI